MSAIIIPKLRPARMLVEAAQEGGMVEVATETGPEYVRPPDAPVDLFGVPGSGKLAAEKFVAVCATCTHLRRAVAAGRDDCHQPCTGPLGGGDYPRHVGLPDDLWSRVCYVCGADATALLSSPRWKKSLGACEKHVRASGGSR